MLEKKNKKVTVRFPKRMKSEMLVTIINSGYGLRGKSKWLIEAVHLLLQQPNFIELCDQGIDINQADLSEVEAFYLDIKTIEIIKNASIKIRKMNPLFVGVQSAIIRSAVIYRLMFGK